MQFSCPACMQLMRCPDDFAGKNGVCPKCKKKILVPAGPPAAADSEGITVADALAEIHAEDAVARAAVAERLANEAPRRPGQFPPANRTVWLVVRLWCLLPILYTVSMIVIRVVQGLRAVRIASGRQAGAGAPDAPPPAVPSGGGDWLTPALGAFGDATFFLGAGFLVLLFFYACWCAVGVVCGFGLDRSIQSLNDDHHDRAK